MPVIQQELLPFLRAAVRSPQVIGGVAPSSARLADRLAAVVPSIGTPTVVELGPGTGVVSKAIARRLPAGGRQLAVELNQEMIGLLGRTLPALTVVAGDATQLRALLAPAGITSADTVIGGLPWSLFQPPQQWAILTEVAGLLDPDGVFTTFNYLNAMPVTSARRFRRMLMATFDEVLITQTVWRNVLPAVTYVCRRPLSR